MSYVYTVYVVINMINSSPFYAHLGTVGFLRARTIGPRVGEMLLEYSNFSRLWFRHRRQ